MIQDPEESAVEQSLRDIERFLGWGSGENWTTQDFSELSEKILKATGVSLSVSTLKRLWGKVNYQNKPSTATLNALVQFMGFENWQVYRQDFLSKSTISGNPIPQSVEAESGTKSNIVLIVGGVVVFLLIASFFIISLFLKNQTNSAAKAGQRFTFGSKMMEPIGVPNSIIFDYDASAASKTDSIFIQQSWDPKRRERVSREKKIHRSVYYYPGFFAAKLVVNDKIVKEQPLYIQTKGWLPLVEQEKVPVYLKPEDAFHTKGVMHLPLEVITKHNIPLQPVVPWISFYNMRKFEGIQTDNFIFTTEIKNDYQAGSAACQLSEIYIIIKEGAFAIPLSRKGCVSELSIFDVKGKIEDTSPLGCDLSQWVKIQLEVKNKKGKLFINNNLAYDNLDFNIPPTDILGIHYRFQGTGSVRKVVFKNTDGRLVYEEDFQRLQVD
jgi:hypothetical protein